jgi:hypothetical protein
MTTYSPQIYVNFAANNYAEFIQISVNLAKAIMHAISAAVPE